jgi:hypothetical protein
MLTLGTPLSPDATKVMLLGSGELGKEVIIALQRLGVETIAVDHYDHAPGQQLAHHSRTIAMSDPAMLRALIEELKPDLVVPEIEAIATPDAGGTRSHWCSKGCTHCAGGTTNHGPRRHSSTGSRRVGLAHQPVCFLRFPG